MARAKQSRRKRESPPLPSKGDAASFGSAKPEPGAVLTALICPDCGGVLMSRVFGKGEFVTFDCQVGHRFSAAELVEAMEQQAENALWAAIERFEELERIHLGLLVRIQKGHRNRSTARTALAFRRRAERAADVMAALRRVLEADQPSDLRFTEALGG